MPPKLLILQVLNVNLSQPGMETVNTVSENAVMGALTNIPSVHSAVVISGESDCVDMQGTALLLQNVQRYVSFHHPICIIIILKLTHQFHS
jgi:hypothetical protein